jgi:hypothetical protein
LTQVATNTDSALLNAAMTFIEAFKGLLWLKMGFDFSE